MISEVNGVRNYKASRDAMLNLYIIFGALATISVTFRFIEAFNYGIKIPKIIVNILAYGVIFGILIPKFFKNNHFSISDKDIVCVKGVLTTKTVYMPMDAVKSVSMVITPLGDRTGVNFVILNALGSRLILYFLNKEDCIDIYSRVNEVIAMRQEPQQQSDK